MGGGEGGGADEGGGCGEVEEEIFWRADDGRVGGAWLQTCLQNGEL